MIYRLELSTLSEVDLADIIEKYRNIRPGLDAERARFMEGAGCTYCNLTGYRGRVAVYELLEVDRALAEAVRRGDLDGFARAARSSAGYVPLAQGAIDFALTGVTSLAEALAVGSGLEERIESAAPSPGARVEAALESSAEPPLAESSVETLLERRS